MSARISSIAGIAHRSASSWEDLVFGNVKRLQSKSMKWLRRRLWPFAPVIASNVFLASKKNGTFRLFINFRALNLFIQKDLYPWYASMIVLKYYIVQNTLQVHILLAGIGRSKMTKIRKIKLFFWPTMVTFGFLSCTFDYVTPHWLFL